MFEKFIVVIVLVAQQVAGQNTYRMLHRSILVEDYNKDYVENPIITLFKYNATTVAFNSTTTLKADLSSNPWAHIKILQSVDGGEYRPYPGKYSINICDAQKFDTFGTRDIFQYSNITDCPFKKGTYYVSNYKPDESKFPSYVPRGELIVVGNVYDGDTFLGSGRWHGTVEDL